MRKYAIFSLIIFALAFLISTPAFADGDQEHVDLLINMIDKNLDKGTSGKTPDAKLEKWKYTNQTLGENLDELRDEVGNFVKSGNRADLPETSSFWASLDNKRKNFKAVVEYRRVLENARKAIKSGKINDSGDLNNFLDDGFTKVQDYINENEPLDITSDFDIGRSMEKLQSSLYDVNMSQADRLINQEWMNTRPVFMYYKQMILDLTSLQNQYTKIVSWNSGKGTMPGEAWSGHGYSGIGAISFDTIWGDSNFNWRDLKVGDTVYPRVSNIRGGSGNYRYEWTVNGRTIGNSQSTSFRFDNPGTYYTTVNVIDSRGRSQWQSNIYNVRGNGNFDFNINTDDTSPMTGQTVYFRIQDARGGRTPYHYKWEMNGRYIGNGTYNQYTFQSSGDYELKVQGRDSNGNSNTKTVNFNVGGSSRIRFSLWSSDTTPRVGQNVDFEIRDPQGGNSPYNYRWRMSNGDSGTDQRFTVRFDRSGHYRLTVTVTDDRHRSATRQFSYNVTGGGSSSGIRGSVSVSNERPRTGELIQLAAMGITGGRAPYTYQWYVDDRRIDDGPSATYTFRNAGNYKVSLRVRDTQGSTATFSKNVQVGNAPSERISYKIYYETSTPDQGMVLPLRIDNLRGGYQPYSFRWEMNGQQFSTQQNASYRFSNAGDYTLKVTVTDRQGTSENRTATFRVKGVLQPLSCNIRAEDPSPKAGQTVRFYVEDIRGGESPYQYLWKMNDSNIGTGSSASYRFSPGTYRLSVEVRDNRGSVTTRHLNFNVSSQPSQNLNCNFSWSPSSPSQGQTVRFRVVDLSGGSPPYKVKWQMNGQQFSSSNETSYTFRNAGTYNMFVEVRDSSGNVKTRSNTFVINPGGQQTGLDFGISLSNNKPSVRDRVNMSVSRLTGGNPPFSVNWSIDGQNIGSGMSVSYAFSRAGSCTITATLTDRSGQTKTVSRTITVGGYSIQPHVHK